MVLFQQEERIYSLNFSLVLSNVPTDLFGMYCLSRCAGKWSSIHSVINCLHTKVYHCSPKIHYGKKKLNPILAKLTH